MTLFSCCMGRRDKVSDGPISHESACNERLFAVILDEANDASQHVKIGEDFANDPNVHGGSYHSIDSENRSYELGEEDEDIMRGVSNVVYRKEYVQTVYSFTSEQLGTGATGPIRAVMNRKTGARFAMKTINLLGFDTSQRERLLQEVLILGRLHHPHIVKLYEVYETPNAMYLIMELLRGGELYTRLINSPMGKFSETYAKNIIKDVLNAIAYLHETKNIAHRDLKLANIMFANTGGGEIKLIDFGLSKFVNGKDYMHSLVGTRYYIAPEVFMNDFKGIGYNKSCDMWSIGVITYFLLTGHNPLPPQMATTPIEEIRIDKIPFPKRYWSELSVESKSFVQGLLQIDPAKRLTVQEAHIHSWFNSMNVCRATAIPDSILTAMREFQEYNHLKKAALTAVAYHLNNNDLMKLGDAFEYFDKHNDGVITFEEFRDAMNTLQSKETIHVDSTVFNITTDEEKLRELFDDIDFDHCGYINYAEFVAACLARKEGLRREYAELIFRLVDRDHEQYITIDDLHRFFGDDISVEEIEAIIKQTFGCAKERLSEQDLEMILNTRMITNNHTEALVTMQSQHAENLQPDQSYITVSSLFSRVQISGDIADDLSLPHQLSTSISATNHDSLTKVPVDSKSEADIEELIRRSKAISVVDELSSMNQKSLKPERNMKFVSLPLSMFSVC